MKFKSKPSLSKTLKKLTVKKQNLKIITREESKLEQKSSDSLETPNTIPDQYLTALKPKGIDMFSPIVMQNDYDSTELL